MQAAMIASTYTARRAPAPGFVWVTCEFTMLRMRRR